MWKQVKFIYKISEITSMDTYSTDSGFRDIKGFTYLNSQGIFTKGSSNVCVCVRVCVCVYIYIFFSWFFKGSSLREKAIIQFPSHLELGFWSQLELGFSFSSYNL